MSELNKIETAHANRGTGERIAVATIIALLIAVQTVYIAKHAVTFAAIIAPSALGIIPP